MFKEKLFSLFNKDSILAELTLLFTMVILPSKEDKLFFWSTNKSSIFTSVSYTHLTLPTTPYV